MRNDPEPSDERHRHDDRVDGEVELPPPPPVDGVPTPDRDRTDEDLVRHDDDHRRDDRIVERDRTDEDLARHDDERIVDRDRDRDIDVDGADRQIVTEDRLILDPDEEIEVVRTRAFSFGQLVTFVVGGLLVALGVVALITTGVDTPLNQPVEDVLGWSHTPLLGIIEVATGALLVLLSLRPGGRWFVALIGLALVLAGILVFAELDWTVEELGAEQSFAWIVALAGVAAVVAALLTPRRHQTVRGVPVVRS